MVHEDKGDTMTIDATYDLSVFGYTGMQVDDYTLKCILESNDLRKEKVKQINERLSSR